MTTSVPLRLPSIWERVFAAIIDGIVIGVPFWSLRVFVTVPDHLFQFGLNLLTVSYLFLAHGPLGGGRTLGKSIMNLRVVQMSGEPATFSNAFKRTFFQAIFPSLALYVSVLTHMPDTYFSFVNVHPLWTPLSLFGQLYFLANTALFLFSRLRRALHDGMADTVVIYVKKTQSPDAIREALAAAPPVSPAPGIVVLILFICGGLFISVGQVFIEKRLANEPAKLLAVRLGPLLTNERISLQDVEATKNEWVVKAIFPDPYSAPVTDSIKAKLPSRLKFVTRNAVRYGMIDPSATPYLRYHVQADSVATTTVWSETWRVDTRTLDVSSVTARDLARPKPVAAFTEEFSDADFIRWMDTKIAELDAANGVVSNDEAKTIVANLRQLFPEGVRKKEPRFREVESIYDVFVNDPTSKETVLKFRDVMNKMGRALSQFVEKKMVPPSTFAFLEQCKRYYDAVDRRIERHLNALPN